METKITKYFYFLAVAALFLCTLPPTSIAAEETKTLTITKDDLGSADEFDLSFAIGGAKVTIIHSDNADVIVQAFITYDSSGPEPDLDTSISGETLNAVFKSGYETDFNYNQFPDIQEWEITIGTYDIDTDVSIYGGGVSGDIDLGGLPLRNCILTLGGVRVNVDFSTPTTRQVEKLYVIGGGMVLSMANIGNTDFEEFNMTGGGFVADLDFEGDYESEQHNVSIMGGGNQLVIAVPSDAGGKVEILAVGTLAFVRGTGWRTTLNLFFLQNHITSDYESQSTKINMGIIVAGSIVAVNRD